MNTSNPVSWDRFTNLLVKNNQITFLISILLVIFIWFFSSHLFNLTDTISSPTLVGATFVEIMMGDSWYGHLFATLRRVIYAFVLTMIVGTFVGVLTGMSNFWEKALQDYVTVALALPSLFAAVFSAMWFGFSSATPMIAGALIAFPFLSQEVYEGIKNIDQELLEMSKSFDISRVRMIRRVIIESILPQWFGGARYSFALCWKVTTLTELVAAENGVGYMIEFQLQQLSVSGILAWTILFTSVMMALEYGVLRQIEKRAFDWRQNATIGWS
jgi:ABC-type nitrate/sulfonate/bicarbonate transport system permease component